MDGEKNHINHRKTLELLLKQKFTIHSPSVLQASNTCTASSLCQLNDSKLSTTKEDGERCANVKLQKWSSFFSRCWS